MNDKYLVFWSCILTLILGLLLGYSINNTTSKPIPVHISVRDREYFDVQYVTQTSFDADSAHWIYNEPFALHIGDVTIYPNGNIDLRRDLDDLDTASFRFWELVNSVFNENGFCDTDEEQINAIDWRKQHCVSTDVKVGKEVDFGTALICSEKGVVKTSKEE